MNGPSPLFEVGTFKNTLMSASSRSVNTNPPLSAYCHVDPICLIHPILPNVSGLRPEHVTPPSSCRTSSSQHACNSAFTNTLPTNYSNNTEIFVVSQILRYDIHSVIVKTRTIINERNVHNS